MRVSPSVPRSTVELAPISTSSSTTTRPMWWTLLEAAALRADVAEAVAADHHARMETTRSPSREAAAITQRACITQSAPTRTPGRARRPRAARCARPTSRAAPDARSRRPIEALASNARVRRRPTRWDGCPGAAPRLGDQQARGAVEVAARIGGAQRGCAADVDAGGATTARARDSAAAPRTRRAHEREVGGGRRLERRDAGELDARRLRAGGPAAPRDRRGGSARGRSRQRASSTAIGEVRTTAAELLPRK